jgi:hypothetical protein
LEARVAECREKVNATTEHGRKTSADLEVVEKTVAELAAQRKQADEAVESASAEARKTISGIKSVISQAVAQRKAGEDRARAVQAAETSIAEIEGRIGGATLEAIDAELRLAKGAEESIAADIARLAAMRDRRTAGIALQNEIRTSEAELARAEVRQKGLKVAAKRAAEILKEKIADGMRDLLEIANRISATIMPEPLIESGGDIGRIVGGSFVSIDSFSGGEYLAAAVGLSLALSGEARPKVAIVDELSRLDLASKARFTERLRDLIEAGEADQFILIDPIPSGYPAGFAVVEWK